MIPISVIMPVYKVEKFVEKAINSILNQTFSDFEFIIVDDGSPDRSGEICDRMAAQDKRITVIHKQNGGAPSARNEALKIAKGKYYYFFDSDDWAEKDMLAEMYRLAENYGAELVVTGFFIDTYYTDTEFVTQTLMPESAVYETAEAFRKNAYRLFDKNLLYTPWNKLYLADYIKKHGITFKSTFWDDFPFNLDVVRDVGRVAVSGRAFYHFVRARSESETAKYNPKMYEKREEEHGWMLALYDYWGLSDIESREFLSRRYVERLIGCFENLTNKNCTLSRAEKRAAVREMLKKPHLAEALFHAKPRSLIMKTLLFPVRMKSAPLILLESAVISRAKKSNTKLFATLKAKR